jgi:hypothetical protein
MKTKAETTRNFLELLVTPCADIQAGVRNPGTLSLLAIAKQTERPARLIHFKVNVLQLFVSLNLQNHWITGVEPSHRCPQLLDGVHWGRI